MKKFLLVISPFVIIGLLVFLFSSPLITLSLQWYAQRFVSSSLGAELTYTSFSREGQTILLEKPRIAWNPSSYCQADSIRIAYNIHPFQRELLLHIVCDEPELALVEASLPNTSSFQQLFVPSAFFRTKGEVVVNKGQFQYIPAQADQSITYTYQFSLNLGRHISGEGTIGQGPLGQTLFSFSSRKGRVHTDISLHAMSLAPLYYLVSPYLPLAERWELQSGTLDGNINICLSSSDEPEFQGALSLSHVSGYDKPAKLQGEIPQVDIQLTKEGQDLARFSLTQPAYFFFGKDKQGEWSLDDFQGDAVLHTHLSMDMIGSGKLHHGEQEFPLQMSGVFSFQDGSASPFSISLGGETSGQDPLHLTLQLLQEQERSKKIAIECHHLDSSIIRWLLPFLHTSSSLLPPFILQEGKIGAEATLLFTDGQLTSCSLPSFQAHNVALSLPEKNRFVTAKEIRGSASLSNEPSKDLFSLLAAHVECLEGSMQDDNPETLTQFSGDIYLEKGEVLPSWIQLHRDDLHGIWYGKGIVTQEKVDLDWRAENIKVDLPSFSVTIPRIGTDEKHYPGTVSYIFATNEWLTTFPIHQGSYKEKNTDLLFTHIDAQATFTKGTLLFSPIQCFCQELNFGGEISLHTPPQPNAPLTLNIHVTTLEGNHQQVQEFLATLDLVPKSPPLPLSCSVGLCRQGAQLRFLFTENDWNLHTTIAATIDQAQWTAENIPLSLHDGSCHFFYDSKTQEVAIENLEGVLLVGPEGQQREVNCIGEHISLHHFPSLEGEFALRLFHQYREFGVICGKTVSYNQDNTLSIEIDTETTRIGAIRPTQFHCLLDPQWQIEECRCEAQLPIHPLLEDLSLLAILSNVPEASGTGYLSLSYSQNNPLSFHLKAEDFRWMGEEISPCSLQGKKTFWEWHVESLQWGKTEVAADFHHQDEEWRVDFLGIQRENLATAGLDGTFYPESLTFDGNVRTFAANLEMIPSWEGRVHGTGSLHLALFPFEAEYHLTSTLQLSTEHLGYGDWHFGPAKEVLVSYDSQEGFVLQNWKSSLVGEEEEDTKLLFQLEKAVYQHSDLSLEVHPLTVTIPSRNLHWAAKQLASVIPPSFQDVIANSKRENFLQATFTCKHNPTCTEWSLSLPQDTYSLYGTPIQCQQFSLAQKEAGFSILTQLQYNQKLFWIEGEANPSFEEGEIRLMDTSPQTVATPNPLRIPWKYGEREMLELGTIQGTFSGLTAQISPTSIPLGDPRGIFQGGIDIDMSRLLPLLPAPLANQCRLWELAEGYHLEGVGDLSFQEPDPLFQFQGIFVGKDFVCKNYRLETLHSEVAFTGDRLTVKDVMIYDQAGKCFVPHLSLQKDGDDWSLSLPRLEVEELRPSLLYDLTTGERGPETPLRIHQLSLRECEGNTSDISTFVGNGELYFTNKSEGIFDNTLFAIPREIITRLGLDPSVLAPVRGTIKYEMQGDKCYFTKFKDVYSDLKGSRFILAKHPEGSWMDFDGNLNLHIKMKQYNLFFKLAELFTVHVGGNLYEPIYTLLD